MAVYKKDNGELTTNAMLLNKSVNGAIKHIIKDAMDDGMEIEEIMYVIYGVAHQIALGYKIKKRLDNKTEV